MIYCVWMNVTIAILDRNDVVCDISFPDSKWLIFTLVGL